MSLTLAFDVYGTLIDTQGVIEALQLRIGDRAPAFSAMWRNKQLEYSFRRGLMRAYRSFDVCTRQALDYVDAVLDTGLDENDKQRLMSGYLELPAFDDVNAALLRLRARDCRVFALSNGRSESLHTLLVNAGIRDHMIDIVSVESLQTFKPDPAIYAYFAERAAVDLADAWLVSSNPFDVIGAVAAGMKSAWLRRSEKVEFDPWEFEPTAVINSLAEIESVVL